MKRIINFVRGSVVIHNFSIGDDINWRTDECDNDSEDEEDPGPDQCEDGTGNDRRRSELFYYLSELEDTNIN